MKKHAPILVAVMLALLASHLACGKGATPTGSPQPSDSKTTATTSPIPMTTSCSDIAQPGKSLVAGGLEMMINAVARPADGIVATGNPANPAPEPGHEFLLLTLSVTCQEDDCGTCALNPAVQFVLRDSSGHSYTPNLEISGVPGMLDTTPFAIGTTVYGSMLFELAQGETELMLLYGLPTATNKACFVVPSWGDIPPGVVTEEAPTTGVSPLATPLPVPTTIPTSTPIPRPQPSLTPIPTQTPTAESTTAPISPIQTPAVQTPESPLETPTPEPTTASDVSPLLPESGKSTRWPLILCALGGTILLSTWLSYLNKT